ncbi:Apoptosis inhibitory protein 5 (API5) [Phytophthora infestans]|uniref:Apoptosis inhibitory protein 5 (API5) n=1 Tax=Phytophthora infestans TaxID=4787 RepID=A0A833SF29_PHYIN|nr:Apoptosis inhibitory protein 5 (API5) [Phytophthora infestans]
MAEDMLTELYAWDSEIEDVPTLAADDTKRDEDKAQDAYEQIVHAATGADASDVVLSLAAQLLHKHFFRFPRVQVNVVDVLLKLCGPKRSQAVRIHTLRALLQIVKAPSPPRSAIASARKWMQRIDDSVRHMLESEKSSVILRQVTPLSQALEERLQPEFELTKSTHTTARDLDSIVQGLSPSERNCKKPRDEEDVIEERTALNRDFSNGGTPRGNDDSSLWKKPLSSSRTVESEGRRQKVSAFSPRNCPPCPYLFLGSVPRHTPSAEIVEFLSPVWPEIDIMSVQLKQPDYNATAYAFVSMPTIEHAREAIHYVHANKFRGRAFLNANFARGPPVDTVLFVERTGEDVNMEDKDAVRQFDFNKCDPEVWDAMCEQLERFGPLSFAEMGCVRFRSVEHAKAVIRKQLFTVKEYEIFPVYDTKEQFTIDSTRRGSNVHSKQGFALKSGRLVGGDADYRSCKNHHHREGDESVDGFNGHRPHDQATSSKYGERRSCGPPRSDRGSARGRSRSRSPKPHNGGAHYDVSMPGPSKERRAPRSRSRSPVTLSKHVAREGGYGTLSDKENCREYRSKVGRRSPSLMDVRSRESPVLVEESRGRPRRRDGPWMESRSVEDSRERRELRGEGRIRRSFHRGGSSSLSSSSRRSRKDDERSCDYRRQGPIEDGRQSYRRDEMMHDERSRMPPAPPGGVLQVPRRSSRSAPRFGNADQRSGGYRGREDRLQVSDERPSFQSERPRYADDRSIAEVARDEQQERQRFFQQQSQGRRDCHDGDISRYGSGRGVDVVEVAVVVIDTPRSSLTEVEKVAECIARIWTALVPRSRSVAAHLPQQHRESYRGRREEFALRSGEAGYRYSPPPLPMLENSFEVGPVNRHELEPGTGDRESSRHERHHHSHRDQSRDDKGHSSHRDYHEKRSSRPERSVTPSPVRRKDASGSSGRNSNGQSPRRSFSRRNEADNQADEASEKEKQPRFKNEDESELQQKEVKNGGARTARDELFAGMDDLTVDYEEDDE